MLTPIEIDNTVFKSSASGYNKSQVDAFKKQLGKDYETLYKKNMEMEDKLSGLNERLNYYASIEKSLHKALVLAEKSAEETRINAENQAKNIVKEAETQAMVLLGDARKELFRLHEQTLRLLSQYETYKAKFTAMLDAEKEILGSEPFSVDIKEFEAYTEYLQEGLKEVKDGSQAASDHS